MLMDLARVSRAKNMMNVKDWNGKEEMVANYDRFVIINMPSSLVLRVVSRSFLLAIFILTLPYIGYISGSLSSEYMFDITGFEYFPELFQDLAYEGLVKMGHKGLILSSGIGHPVVNLQFLYDNNIELVVESDLDGKSSFPDEEFDIVFWSSLEGSKNLIDRILKLGGIVVMELGNGPAYEFQKDSSYKIVYLRRFDSTVLAMRKTGFMNQAQNSVMTRKLCGFMPETKKNALKGLEDVWLEPPLKALMKPNKLRRKFRVLPDLLGESLESFPRRIFITDEKSKSLEWFKKNFPTKSQGFEICNLEMEMNVKRPATSRISDWMLKNVKKEDYVVMKAEAQMVEEMMIDETISLVDELFLECKNQRQDGSRSKRAYWQCLALYGRLTDQGIAVHQWLI